MHSTNSLFFTDSQKSVVGFPTNIQLFIYRINHERESSPFIEFILESMDEIFSLPKIHVHPTPVIKKRYMSTVLSKSFRMIQSILHPNVDIGEQFYKGCIQNENTVTLFFDCSFVFQLDELDNAYIFSIMSEVVDFDNIGGMNMKIHGKMVHDSVSQLFVSGFELFKDFDFDIPLLYYGCELVPKKTSNENDNYESESGQLEMDEISRDLGIELEYSDSTIGNISCDEASDVPTEKFPEYQNIRINENISRLYYPKYGNFFYFTKTCDISRPLHEFQRFAVFQSPNLSIEFKSRGIDFLCVKTEYQIVKLC
jgi:hypothetical protein